MISENLIPYSKQVPAMPPDFTGEHGWICKLKKLNDLSDLLSDNYKWRQQRKGLQTIVPKYRNFPVEGGFLKIIECVNVHNHIFRKNVIYKADCSSNIISDVFFYYFSSEKLDVAEITDKSRSRLTDEKISQVRGALDGRSVRTAQQVLEKAGVFVKDREIRNQVRHVENVVRIARGPRCTTLPSELADLASLQDGQALFRSGNSENKPYYTFCWLSHELIKVYVSGLPTIQEMEKMQQNVSSILKLDHIARKMAIGNLLADSANGVVKGCVGQLSVDTTFGLTDAYVTIVTGQTSNFVTSTSKKHRSLLIGFMIHSMKEKAAHEIFSNFLSEKLSEADLDSNKCIPTFVSDGEKALDVYLKRDESILSKTVKLRCDVHRRSNLQFATSRRSCSSEVIALIFGKVTHDVFEGGLLASCTRASFDKRLETLKPRIPAEVHKWLFNRSEDLFKHHCLAAKLKGGVVQQYVTTNSIESINNTIKLKIPRAISAGECAVQLQSICEAEKKRLVRCVSASDEQVAFPHSDIFNDKTDDEKAEFLRSIGFLDADIIFLEMGPVLAKVAPQTNWKALLEKEINCKVHILNDGNYIVGNDSKSFVLVRAHETRLACTNEYCTKHPTIICVHLFAVWRSLSNDDRSAQIRRFSAFVSNSSKKSQLRLISDPQRGSKRKFAARSKHNHARNINNISMLSLDSPTLATQFKPIASPQQSDDSRAVSPRRLDSLDNSDSSVLVDVLQIADSINSNPDEIDTISSTDESFYGNRRSRTRKSFSTRHLDSLDLNNNDSSVLVEQIPDSINSNPDEIDTISSTDDSFHGNQRSRKKKRAFSPQ